MKKITYACIFISIFLMSCTSYKYVPNVKNHEKITHNIDEEKKISLFINSIHLESGESLNATFQNKLINSLKTTRVFDEVIFNASKKHLDEFISVDITIDEEIDLHENANYRKAYLAGLTLFASTPFTNLKYDYGLNIEYNFKKRNQSKKVICKSERILSKKYFSKEKPDQLLTTVYRDTQNQLNEKIQSNLDFFSK